MPDGEMPAPVDDLVSRRLEHLFQTVRPPAGQFPRAKGMYSNEHVARTITERGGPKISSVYVWMLRRGDARNPTLRHLQALGWFFGVPVAYFVDEDVGARVEEDLAMLRSLEDGPTRQIVRGVAELSDESVAMVAELVSRLRRLEAPRGADPAAGGSQSEDGEGD